MAYNRSEHYWQIAAESLFRRFWTLSLLIIVLSLPISVTVSLTARSNLGKLILTGTLVAFKLFWFNAVVTLTGDAATGMSDTAGSYIGQAFGATRRSLPGFALVYVAMLFQTGVELFTAVYTPQSFGYLIFPFALLAGAFYLRIVTSYALQASILDGQKMSDAARTSREYGKATWERLFLLLLIFTILTQLVSLPFRIDAESAVAVDFSSALLRGLLHGAVLSLIEALFWIATTLLYIDKRNLTADADSDADADADVKNEPDIPAG